MAIYLNNKMIGINNTTIVEHNINTTTTVEPLSITSNGTYTAPSGQAYSPITANVQPTLKPILLRPDAELISTYSRDYKVVEDDEITIPAYATSSQSLQASTNLSPTLTLDYSSYNYYQIQRMLAIPEYSISSGKGKVEYDLASALIEIIEMAPGTCKSLDGTISQANYYVPACTQTCYCSVYWPSATTIMPYATSNYGIILIPTIPTASAAGVLTSKTPALNIRGHSTYFTSTYFNALTEIRVQYIIETYRAPKNNLNIDGWGNIQQVQKILNCIQTNNCKLI